MTEYIFTLRFRLACPDQDPAELEVALFEAGCDDATIGIGQPGRLALAFVREAATAREAMASALAAVRKASPGAVLVEAAPDLVGLSDVAALVGCSRQNMRKLMLGHAGSFPSPVHDGSTALWHLASLLEWLRNEQGQAVDDSLLELAWETRRLNLARDVSSLDRAGRHLPGSRPSMPSHLRTRRTPAPRAD